MKLIKTILIFILNKLLELWHLVIKELSKTIIICVVLIALIFSTIDIIGFITIGLIDAIGLHSLAYTLFISIYDLDAPIISRGFVTGAAICALSGLALSIREQLKYIKIISFIKSNWDMAKKGQIYRYK